MAAESPSRPIRVAISDDHPVVRQGLRSFLEAQGFEVVGEAADGRRPSLGAVRRRPRPHRHRRHLRHRRKVDRGPGPGSNASCRRACGSRPTSPTGTTTTMARTTR